MKTNVLTLAMSLLLASATSAQSPEEEKLVKQVIINFSSFGDQQDAESLDRLLDANFRVIMNQLFGSKEVSVMDKTTYLGKISAKEFGGDRREVKIENLQIDGKTALARVTLKGSKMTMMSVLQLIKNNAGNWQLISDLPTIL